MPLDERDAIDDPRGPADFKALTFSGYKKANVKKELLEAMLGGKVENSCYWCAEMVCTGMLTDVWNTVIRFVSEYVNMANPKMPIYVEKRYSYFRRLMHEQGTSSAVGDLSARNSAKIRELFTELMCTLAVSKRRPKMPMVKLDPEKAFDMHSVSQRLKAPSIKYAREVFRAVDPKELFIPINELAFHVSHESRNGTSACYWIEWILQFERNSVQNDELCKCAVRPVPPEIADKHANDVGWLIWDALKREVKRRNAALLTRIVDALYFLYCFRYKAATARKRRPIFYCVCYLLTEPVDVDQKIIENQASLLSVIEKTNTVYRQIKKSEVQGRVDYLKTII